MPETLNSWFAREVLPHEAALMRYLNRICPNRDDIVDLRQDVYVRIYEAAGIERPTWVKPLLLSIARNLVVDRIRRSRIVSIQPASDSDLSNVLMDEISPERRLNSYQELKQLGVAFSVLPKKCREVVWLRKVEQMPQAEVARFLGISVRTVEFHVQKGMRILAQTLFGDDTSNNSKREIRGQSEGLEDEQ